jgi:transposase
MAGWYRGGDRQQPFLLPPDVREWLPEGHFAWLVIEVIKAVDTSEFHARSRRGGRGRAGFDPDVLLALLMYCYALGVVSSRRIERMCETDVACRVITANEVPDHTVIARFRQAHEDAFKTLFVRVLAFCAAEGMGQVGTITLDGTKLAANASRHANRTRERLAAEVDRIVADADAADTADDELFHDDARGDELPERLAPGADRLDRLRACLADIDDDQRPSTDERAQAAAADVERLQAQLAAAQAQRARYEADRDAGRRGLGVGRPEGVDTPPRPSHIARKRQALETARARLERHRQRLEADQGRKAQRNPTDPDSRLMRSQGAWQQGYNAQAATARDGVIVACDVTNLTTDAAVFLVMLAAVYGNLEAAEITQIVRVILADAGYHSEANLAADGPPRLIPPHKPRSGEHSQRMRRRLAQPAMARLYKRRSRVERVFAQIKHNQGIRGFTRRGLAAVNAEWNLICLTHNLRTLHNHRAAQPATTA